MEFMNWKRSPKVIVKADKLAFKLFNRNGAVRYYIIWNTVGLLELKIKLIFFFFLIIILTDKTRRTGISLKTKSAA